MPRTKTITPFLLALAALTATATAQNAAPIERVAPRNIDRVSISTPAPGIVVRSGRNAAVRTVTADADVTELSVLHGRANVSVHNPANGVQILVDLPGGQTALLKDGLYTFNADTNTVRVLKGEARTFATPDAKGIKVKEDHQVVLGPAAVRSVEVSEVQARADLLPGTYTHNPERHYDNGFYGDGYGYDYPYYGYGFGYPGYWDYPYGYGYPFGFGVGFGFRGGFGGFHGRR